MPFPDRTVLTEFCDLEWNQIAKLICLRRDKDLLHQATDSNLINQRVSLPSLY